jgi:hypothetical protein
MTSPVAALRRVVEPRVAGGLGVVLTAGLLYSRFDLHAKLVRDSAIYLYGGQRFIHGVPPYASIMDPKGPLSGILCGFGVAVAKLFHRSDVLVVRAEFCALAVLGVLGIYLLVLELWHSVVAGVVAAVVFTAFRSFAYNALVGPEGHLPGIVFMIFALWLTVRKRWYWAGFAASLAFLTWQPLFPYVVIALICATAWSPGHRLRAAAWSAAGSASPLIVLIVYYAASGYLGSLFQGLFVYPLTGVQRTPRTIGHRLHFFVADIARLYGPGAILFWGGLLLMLAAVVWTVGSARSQWRTALLSPIVLLISFSFVTQVAYVLYDYIGYPHTYPLLPYAAVGFGFAVAQLVHRLSPLHARRATAALAAAVTALAVTCAVVYSKPTPRDGQLPNEQAGACAIQRSLVPGTPLWVIDNMVPLVLLHRRQPDNFPYVGGGLDIWKVRHTSGGFDGWMRQIQDSRASIVIVQSWVRGKYKGPILHWLPSHGFRRGFIGTWPVYVTRGARAEMTARSIALSDHRHDWPQTTTGGTYRVTHCTKAVAG